MFAKVVYLAILLVRVNCRYLLVPENDFSPISDIDYVTEKIRVKRAQATISADNKGTVELSGRVPFAKIDNNILSATGSTSPNGLSYGIALDNIKGHSLSLSEKHIPEFGKQQTLLGNINFVNTDKHDFNANAFITKNIPKFNEMPNFKTVGGGLDYTYNKKIGAGVNLAHTDFLKKTDVSAMGNLNLFRNPSTSVDFSAGASRTFSPYFPKSSWEPDFRFSLSKYF